MARTRKSSGFTALRVVGSILPPEFLAVIAAQEAKHQAGSDYGLTKSLSLKDELARYWRIAKDLHTAYAERRERADLNLSKVGIDDWLAPFLKEVLGFDDLAPARALLVADRTFQTTHQAFGGTVPILLTTREYELDRANPRFGEEGRRRAPHGLMQEMLNASNAAIWGIVANGAKLRVLRDNPSLTRPAYIEADLDLIFTEQLYPEFAALWLLSHASRFRPVDGKPPNAILERWRAEAHETGERALEHLRESVTEALRQLGNGFLQHPENERLRAALSDGSLSAEHYFQELLRLVYRLLFLFTAEERNLLHLPSVSDEQRVVYAQGYSLALLRDRALKRRHYDRHHDLWQGLMIVFRALARGEPALALPALGGLFAQEQCSNLEAGLVSNERLLEAIHALAYFRTATGLARVNYRDMGTEELGSVYESLLELHALIDVDAPPWTFGFIGEADGEKTKGSERKLTGSYYTPAALVNELIKSALEPVMAEVVKANPSDPSKALLNLKIVDPACGSGHFLLAAARRVAAQIAHIDAGSDTPDEAARQHALREVVQHCIYGVDRNPLAVELCRTALWIETIEPGKPLTFLGHHIQCGDSLVGVLGPSVMVDGIPNEAFKELTGDDKEICKALRKRNREAEHRARHGDLFANETAPQYRVASVSLDDMPEETLSDVATKRERWERLHQDPDFLREKHRADLFIGAYFAPKTRATAEYVPLTEDLLLLSHGQEPRAAAVRYAEELAARHRFFHWHLAFPDIMQKGGFDVVLGNPPWERIKLQEQEFFASRSPEIAQAPNKAARDKLIRALARPDAHPAEKALLRTFEDTKRAAEAASLFVRTGGRYPLTGVGDVNTYALFAETFRQIVAQQGRAGFIVPSGLATDNTTKDLFDALVSSRALASFFEFENAGFFPGAGQGHMLRFALTTIVGPGQEISETRFLFQGKQLAELADEDRVFTLSPEDIFHVNPNTKTCPIFQSRRDTEIAKAIYARVPVLMRDADANSPGHNPWGIRFMAMFHMANDSHLFKTKAELEQAGYTLDGNHFVRGLERYLPLYEAKMIYQYNHRHGDFHDSPEGERAHVLPSVPVERLCNPNYLTLPFYWVAEAEVRIALADKEWSARWLLGWRDVTDARASARTLNATVIPLAAANDGFLLMLPKAGGRRTAALLANLCALVCDFVARQKVGGLHLKYFTMKQLPILAPDDYSEADLDFIVPRVLELTYTARDLEPWARDLGYEGPPFTFDPERRAELRAELDAYYAHLYGLDWEALCFILHPQSAKPGYPSETFSVLKRSEEKEFGEYRTQRLVLEAWGRLERGELAPPSPAIRIATRRAEPVDVSALPDGAWARPMQDQRAETGILLAATLKAMNGPLPARQVRLAALLALEPRLLLPYLNDKEAATWRRLVGTEGDPLPQTASAFVARNDQAWGAAVRSLRANGQLIEDVRSGTWAPGDNFDKLATAGWPDGRASMVLSILGRQAMDTVIAALPADLRGWVDEAAA